MNWSGSSICWRVIPHLKGETTERDEIGRTVEVKFVAKFKVIYWSDHAVKEVKILRLERLPRG